jgi:serine/threonine protein kinase
MSSVENSNVLRNMACNILGGVGINSIKSRRDSTKPSDSYLKRLKNRLTRVPSGGMAQAIFKSRLSTAELTQMAFKSLRDRSTTCANKSEFQKAKAIFDVVKGELGVELGVERFRESNPIVKKALTTLHEINTSTIADPEKKLGEGTFGKVYAFTMEIDGKPCEFIVKVPTDLIGSQQSIDTETAVGDAIRERFGQMNSKDLVSDFQGLLVISVPVKTSNGLEIQERIVGMDGWGGIKGSSKQENGQSVSVPPLPIFANGFVDNPQKAIERAGGLAMGLHALHRAGKVHSDLKTPNIMFEEIKNGAGQPASDYRIRVIDLGATVNAGSHVHTASDNKAPECELGRPAATSHDIYAMGTMLPSLFFGQAGENTFGLNMFGNPSRFVQHFRDLEDGMVRSLPKGKQVSAQMDQYNTELESLNAQKQQMDSDIYNQQQQLQANWNAYNSRAQWFSASQHTMPPQNRQAWTAALAREYQQIANSGQALAQYVNDHTSQYQKGMAALGAKRQTIDAQIESLRPSVQKELQQAMRNEISGHFQSMNIAMKEATGKKYPPEVLERLAHMTADCLAMDPSKRPTAEHVLLGLQNMGLSDWGEANPTYNIGSVPELTREQAEIREQFPWIGA